MKIYITFVTNYKFLYNFKLAFEESIPNSRDKISESSPNSIHFQDRIRLTEIFAFPHRGVKFLLLAFHKRGSISLSLSFRSWRIRNPTLSSILLFLRTGFPCLWWRQKTGKGRLGKDDLSLEKRPPRNCEISRARWTVCALTAGARIPVTETRWSLETIANLSSSPPLFSSFEPIKMSRSIFLPRIVFANDVHRKENRGMFTTCRH